MATKKTKKKTKKKARGPRLRKMRDVEGRPETSKARTILRHAHDSAEAFIDAFEGVRTLRNAGAGRPTDEEQDLLRAMLVIAAAGLDSMLKQTIRDALPELVRTDSNVREGLEGFVARQLRSDAPASDAASGHQFLAKLLVSESHRDELIEQYILSLTGSSLQSADELFRTAVALGIDPKDANIKKPDLKPIFHIRNQIIHELDINFDEPIRNRFPRSRGDMTRHANRLLELGDAVLRSVEERLGRAVQ